MNIHEGKKPCLSIFIYTEVLINLANLHFFNNENGQ